MKTFAELYASADEELRYRLDERAAIHQYDGGLTKDEAEKRTAEDYQRDMNSI